MSFPPPGSTLPSTAPPRLSTGRAGWWCALLAICWVGLTALWLARDHALPDGDEQGHVGAAALFAGDLREQGPLAFAERLLVGETGEYPGLYPAALGLGWAALGEGQPGRLPLRLLNLGFTLLGALAAGRLAARLAPPGRAELAMVAGFGATLLGPEANGIARAFMPEGALLAAVGGATLAAARAAERPDARRAAELGLALGLGLLTKQTFALYALAPALYGLVALRGRAALALGLALAVAGPWYLGHLGAQLGYGAASAGPDAAVGLLDHLLYYPLALGWSGLGPALGLGLLLSLRRARPSLPALTLIVGLLLLVAVPKKYPRLLVPLLPAAAAVLGASLARRPLPVSLALGGAAAGWVVLGSVRDLPPPGPIRAMASGCVQRWLRGPEPDDFGLPEVEAAARGVAGPVIVIAGPEIPCEVRTTPPWVEHLRPWLEHAGLDREVLERAPGEPAPPGLVVDWSGGPGARVEVPALGAGFALRDTTIGAEPW